MSNDALVTALFAAYATFTAFGAAVAGFVAAGGAVQSLTSWWTQHGEDKAPRWLERTQKVLEQHRSLRWLTSVPKILPKLTSPSWITKIVKIRQWSARAAIIVVTLIILAVIVISGAGLVLCFIWLDAYSHGSVAGVTGVYTTIVVLFWVEAWLLTGATMVAVIAAAGSALTSSGSANKARVQAKSSADQARDLASSSAHLDSALREAALYWLDRSAKVGGTEQEC